MVGPGGPASVRSSAPSGALHNVISPASADITASRVPSGENAAASSRPIGDDDLGHLAPAGGRDQANRPQPRARSDVCAVGGHRHAPRQHPSPRCRSAGNAGRARPAPVADCRSTRREAAHAAVVGAVSLSALLRGRRHRRATGMPADAGAAASCCRCVASARRPRRVRRRSVPPVQGSASRKLS